jgi:FkbM family methyltransferase
MVETAVLSRLSGTGVFIDIGANVGHLALTAAARRTGTIVLAVEPNPCTAAILRKNVARNGLARAITVIEVACGDKAGPALFFMSSTDHSGKSSLSESSAGRARKKITVALQKVDEIVEAHRLPTVELVKIDVEGNELAVLKGMERTISMFRPSILVEIVPTLLAAFGVREYDIDDFLVGRGYVKHSVSVTDALFVPQIGGSILPAEATPTWSGSSI